MSVAPTSVTLPPEKFAAANLHTTIAALAPIQETRPVPATLTYDAARRVPVNAPVSGVVMKVLAEPGRLHLTRELLEEI